MLDPISRNLLAGAGNRGPVVLMYHALEPGGGTPDWPWAVSRERFLGQLELLRSEGWTTHRVSDLVAGNPLPPRAAVITFDDGYADNYGAFEALAERGMTATWYMVTADVGRESRWKDQPPGRRAMLAAGQLRAMAEAGMEIGAHTRHHARLPEVDDATLADEVGGSRAELEGQLGRAVDSFAYPYGLYDDRVAEAVRHAGYSVACTTRTGWGMVGGDPMQVRRVAVFNTDSVSSFARKLVFADNDVSWRRIGRYYRDRVRARLPGARAGVSKPGL
jgi:peptidoglycan/xylan/chitin deacetylase (PgdA/CDA1 family)